MILEHTSAFSIVSVLTAGSLFLLALYLRRYRDRPGAVWFIATLSVQGLWCLFYALGLMTPDPAVRVALELLSWVALIWIGVLFLGFALDYTGRSDLRRSAYYYGLWVIPASGTVLILTNPLHQLIWTNTAITTVLGTVAVDYNIQFLGFVFIASGFVLTGIAVVLLVNAALSYGELYRREATAVALSTVPPTIGLLVWLFDVGPTSVLNWGVPLSLPHAVLDAYAFARTGMFESNPVTQRRANQEAIDAVADPVVILDDAEQIVDYNDRAAEVFPMLSDESTAGATLDQLPIETAVLYEDSEHYATVHERGTRYEFAISSSALVDSRGQTVGHTVLFRDVTDEREREQRLEVLNRVLRHNIRNKLTVIVGSVESIQTQTDDDTVERFAEMARESGDDLVEISEKARRFDDLRERDPEFDVIDVAALVESTLSTYDARYESATIERAYPASHEVLTDSFLLESVLDNLLENAFEHSGEDPPHVTVALDTTTDDGSTEVVISDRGPGIPAEEIAVIQAGTESELAHASGLGLWIARWCATRINASLEFETGEAGTTVSVRLPANPLDDH